MCFCTRHWQTEPNTHIASRFPLHLHPWLPATTQGEHEYVALYAFIGNCLPPRQGLKSSFHVWPCSGCCRADIEQCGRFASRNKKAGQELENRTYIHLAESDAVPPRIEDSAFFSSLVLCRKFRTTAASSKRSDPGGRR